MGLFDAFGNIVGTYMDLQWQQELNNYNINAWEYEQGFAREQWEEQIRQWEASTLSGQIEQAKENGINPATIYAQSGASGTKPNSPVAGVSQPSPQVVSTGNVSFGDMFKNIAQTKLMNAQANTEDSLRQAKLENIRYENSLLQSQTALNELGAEEQAVVNEFCRYREAANIGYTNSMTRVNRATELKLEQERKTIAYNLNNLLPLEYQLKEQEIANAGAQYGEIISKIMLNAQQCKVSEAQETLLDNQSNLVESQTAGQDIQNDIQKSAFNDIVKAYELECSESQARIDKLRADKKISDRQAEILRADYKYYLFNHNISNSFLGFSSDGKGTPTPYNADGYVANERNIQGKNFERGFNK